MKLIGLQLVRNESWVLGCSIRVALKWCDGLVVLDHASTDNTGEIVREVAERCDKPITLLRHDDAEKWDEMDLRQRTLEVGRKMGGTHFAVIDGDEVLTDNHVNSVRTWFDKLLPGECLDVQMISPWKSLDKYRIEKSVWTDAQITLGFRDASFLSWKPRGEERYQHHARPPHGSGEHIPTPTGLKLGGVFHLQWASWQRLIAKHRVYKMMERIRWPQYEVFDIDRKYNMAPDQNGVCLADVPQSWWGDHPRNLIDLNHEPWYNQEARRLWQQYGKSRFEGLNLFGWEGGE